MTSCKRTLEKAHQIKTRYQLLNKKTLKNIRTAQRFIARTVHMNAIRRHFMVYHF